MRLAASVDRARWKWVTVLHEQCSQQISNNNLVASASMQAHTSICCLLFVVFRINAKGAKNELTLVSTFFPQADLKTVSCPRKLQQCFFYQKHKKCELACSCIKVFNCNCNWIVIKYSIIYWSWAGNTTENSSTFSLVWMHLLPSTKACRQ